MDKKEKTQKQKKLFDFLPLWVILPALVIFLAMITGMATSMKDLLAGAFRTRVFCWLVAGGLFIGLLVTARLLLARMAFPRILVGAFALCILNFLYLFVLPPMSAPDEIRHFISAYRISNIIMFRSDVEENGMAYMRAEDANPILNDHPGIDDYEKMFHNLTGEPLTDTVLCTLDDAEDTIAPAYLPQALGITLGRLLHLRQVPLILLARLVNLIIFWILIFAALRALPAGHIYFLLPLAFPMTMELTASLSYDAIVIGLAYFYTAHIIRLALDADRVEIKDLVLLIAVLCILAPIKLIYLAMGLMAFMIPKEKFGLPRSYRLSIMTAVLIVGGVFCLTRLSRIGYYASGNNAYVESMGGSRYTLMSLLTDPLNTIAVLLNTLRVYAADWYGNMIGSHLAWLDVRVSDLVMMGFTVLMLGALLRPGDDAAGIKPGARRWGWAAFGLAALLLTLGMLLGCTLDHAPLVSGIQGRYFIPLMPLLLLISPLNRKRPRDGETAKWLDEHFHDGVVIYGALCLNAFAIVESILFIGSRMGINQMFPS